MLRAAGALALFLVWLVPGPAGSQEPARNPAYGVVTGPVGARQLRERSDDSERHAGFMVGAWIDVPTPASWLTVTAEAAAARRGGEYHQGPDLPVAAVDVDYLVASVFPSLRLAVGPLAFRAYAGPSLDIHLRSTASRSLEQTFPSPSTQVLAALAGVGVEVVAGRAVFRLEARRHEQVSSAFTEIVDGLRHRSTELLFRLGMRPRR